MPPHDPDAYWEAISLQAADRASRYRTGGINQKFGRDGSRFTEIDKRFARRRSLDWGADRRSWHCPLCWHPLPHLAALAPKPSRIRQALHRDQIKGRGEGGNHHW